MSAAEERFDHADAPALSTRVLLNLSVGNFSMSKSDLPRAGERGVRDGADVLRERMPHRGDGIIVTVPSGVRANPGTSPGADTTPSVDAQLITRADTADVA
jgi:hypothetical protein